jgi:hypothetical protein
MARGNQAPFVVAAMIAAVPLLVLAAAAPGGHDWVWLEYPRGITFVAFVLGFAACFVRSRQLAPFVLVGTVAYALGSELIGEYIGLSKFGKTELMNQEMGLLVDLSIARAAPWLMGSLFTIIAWLSIGRGRDKANRERAAIWLAVVGVVAAGITLANHSWLTLENLKGDGTYRDSSSWPDTKKISLVIDLVTIAIGGFALVYRPKKPDPLPKATLQK